MNASKVLTLKEAAEIFLKMMFLKSFKDGKYINLEMLLMDKSVIPRFSAVMLRKTAASLQRKGFLRADEENKDLLIGTQKLADRMEKKKT